MRRADFCRAKDSRFNLVTHCEKVFPDVVEAEGDMPEDVFSEQERRLYFSEDSADVRPQVARVFFSEAFSGLTERLTWVSGSEETDVSPGSTHGVVQIQAEQARATAVRPITADIRPRPSIHINVPCFGCFAA